MPNLYIDMDGCVAKWQSVSLEILCQNGYFRNLSPDRKLIEAIHIIRDAELFICSKYLEGTNAYVEKKEWISEYMPFIKSDHIILVPYRDSKYQYIRWNDGSINLLLDDHTPNLLEWEKFGGVGIKYLNGINGKNGRWKGLRLDGTMRSDALALTLTGILRSFVEPAAA